MSHPERSPANISDTDAPATPTPPQDVYSGREKPPDAGEIVRRNQVRYDHRQLCFALNCDRHEIFAEWLATPIRPARDAWFSAWRSVADRTACEDSEAVVKGVVAAATAYAQMEAVFIQWFRKAREWRKRASPIYSGFNVLIGFDTLETFAEWDSERQVCLPSLLSIKRDYFERAFAIERLESLRQLHDQTSFLHCSDYVVPGHCLDLLALIMARPSAEQVRSFFKATRGPSWLAGLTGMLAVAVGPLLPEDVFRPVDLPADDLQRSRARYLAKLTTSTFMGDGQGVRFARQYFPLPPSPPNPPMELTDWDDEAADTPDSPEADVTEASALPKDTPAPPALPAWDAKTRTLTAGGKSKSVRSNGKRILHVLEAFELAEWPADSVTMANDATPGDRAKCIDRFLVGFPIDIKPDGTGNGMTWAWKSGG